MITRLVTNYFLEEAVVDRIELYTSTFIGDNGNTKDVRVDDLLNIFEEEYRFDIDKNLPKSK